MRVAIAARDAGDDLAIQRIAFLGPVDVDPERLPTLLGDHCCGVGHSALAYLASHFAAMCGSSGERCKGKLRRGAALAPRHKLERRSKRACGSGRDRFPD